MHSGLNKVLVMKCWIANQFCDLEGSKCCVDFGGRSPSKSPFLRCCFVVPLLLAHPRRPLRLQSLEGEFSSSSTPTFFSCSSFSIPTILEQQQRASLLSPSNEAFSSSSLSIIFSPFFIFTVCCYLIYSLVKRLTWAFLCTKYIKLWLN